MAVFLSQGGTRKVNIKKLTYFATARWIQLREKYVEFQMEITIFITRPL